MSVPNSQGDVENNLTISQKVKCTLIIQPNKSLLGIYPNDRKKYVYTDLYANVHISIIGNSHKMEKSRCAFTGE